MKKYSFEYFGMWYETSTYGIGIISRIMYACCIFVCEC